MTLQINLNLLADNNGIAGEALTQDRITVNDSFFVEIEVADSRDSAAGVIGLALDIEWNASVLEALDIEVTDKLSFNQQGAIDNDNGLIDDLGGGAIPSADIGEAIGINTLERFALIHFQGELVTDNPIPLTVTVANPSDIAFADGISFNDDTEIETQTIEVIAATENNPPILVNEIADITTLEDSELSFTIPDDTFQDPDEDDSLTYSATLESGDDLPAWLTFDANTQTFSGTPDNDNVGNLDIKVTASDNNNETISDSFILTVENVDDAPTVNNEISDVTVLENGDDTIIDLANTFTDIDNDDRAIIKTITINSNRDLVDTSIEGDRLILDYQDNNFGTADITIEGESNGLTVTNTFTVTVEEVDNGEYLIGGEEADELNGTNRDDSLFGGGGDDSIRGGEGNDFLIGLTDNDLIEGDAGNDTLVGYSGNDLILGKEGDDTLLGNQNHDTLDGGEGNDILSGGLGNDILSGGMGNDALWGKEGADIFVLELNSGQDLVGDFSNGIDRIGLTEGIVFEDLTITGGNNAQIIDSNDRVLMILSGINADVITSEDFIALSMIFE